MSNVQPRLSNTSPVTSQHPEHVSQLDVDFPNLVEAIKADGPMTQKEIAAATGIAETPTVPLCAACRGPGYTGFY